MHNKRFPGESDAYRKQRNELLKEEIKLRKRLEKVAQLRRALPFSAPVKKEYNFQVFKSNESIYGATLGKLFENEKKSLVIYGFMYHPDANSPCPSCTSIIDGLNGQFDHINDRINFVVMAKSPINKIKDLAYKRNWNKITFVSSFNTSFNADYHSETESGNQIPALNVFHKNEDGQVYHFYNSELLYVDPEQDQSPRHVDLIWPLWNIFDLTPEGRGTDWYPKLDY